MATDKNKFDAHLKEKLYRDIVFRVALIGVLAVVAAIIKTAPYSADAIADLIIAARKLTPLLNTIGVVAILLPLPALLLKDLAHIAPDSWGYDSRASWWGGFIRRLAGDLTLWLLGTLVAFFFAMAGATGWAIGTRGIGLSDGIHLIASYIVVAIFIVITSMLNVLVRREAPPFTADPRFPRWLRRPWSVAVLHGAIVLMASLFVSCLWRAGS